MKKHILMVALALSLTLAGCGSSADDQTVTVTGSANVRDGATTEGSSVLETLSAGTELTGRWVAGETNSSEQWLEFERDGEKAYVFARNLSQQPASQYASSAQEQPISDLRDEGNAAQSAAPANLTELSYDELARQLRARENECDKSFGRNDGKINEQQRSCYSKYKIKYTDACYEKDENAKRECANSENLKQCLEIKHPEAATNIFISGCMAL